MEPKKAKIAIAITIAVALIIVSACLLLLFEIIPFQSKDEQAQNITIVLDQSTNTPSATTAPVEQPSAKDLKGCSDDLYLPKAESYLPEYTAVITHAAKDGDKVCVLYKPQKWQYTREVILKLDNNEELVALAQENGYTLVLVKKGVAGWILSSELDPA